MPDSQSSSIIQGASRRTEKKEVKLVEVEEVEEWEVVKILNKRKVRGVVKLSQTSFSLYLHN